MVAGWKGADWTCLILYFVVKSWKSADVKAIALFVTRVSGSPCVTNSFHRAHMITEDNVVNTRTISYHCEWESNHFLKTFKISMWVKCR